MRSDTTMEITRLATKDFFDYSLLVSFLFLLFLLKIGALKVNIRKHPDALKPGSPSKSASASFREGDKVEARFHGKLRYYPGVIRRANRDSTYDIDYDDGEKEVS